jgi:hypothetical protein
MILIKVTDSAILELNHNLGYNLVAKKLEGGWEVMTYIRTKEHTNKLIELLAGEKIIKFVLHDNSAICAKKILAGAGIEFEQGSFGVWNYEFSKSNVQQTKRFIG